MNVHELFKDIPLDAEASTKTSPINLKELEARINKLEREIPPQEKNIDAHADSPSTYIAQTAAYEKMVAELEDLKEERTRAEEKQAELKVLKGIQRVRNLLETLNDPTENEFIKGATIQAIRDDLTFFENTYQQYPKNTTLDDLYPKIAQIYLFLDQEASKLKQGKKAA